MTAKTFASKSVVDCTRGVSREQRAINRRKKLDSLTSSGKKLDSLTSSGRYDRKRKGSSAALAFSESSKRVRKLQEAKAASKRFRELRRAELAERYGRLPDRVATDCAFEEKSFGYTIETSADDTKDAQVLKRIVVSLALFDGDKMLFACSGIPLPDSSTPSKLHLTRFVTSARLATEFNANRYRDDKLRVEVRLPHDRAVLGLLGLYDENIAIVTSLCHLDVHPIDLGRPVDLKLQARHDDGRVLAIGCLFKSDSLMATGGYLHRERSDTWVSDTQDLSEAVLGGPLIGNGARFLGMNHKHHGDANVTFLSQQFLCERLEHFQILNPKELHFRGYSLPEGVFRIVPSGLLDNINLIRSCGYPIPPPLVMELNGQLRNRFEDYFGDIISWRWYSSPPMGSEYRVWKRLPKKVVTDVSHRVVSVASFHGKERFFACTGLLIKWRGKRSVVLTSASLVRSSRKEDVIDKNLSIKVFVPPNHIAPNHISGKLEWYHLNYNIAIVSLLQDFRAIRREDIFKKEHESSGKVVEIGKKVIGIGRDPVRGLLMASFGEVIKEDAKLDCKDLKLSTCKIKKAGIGGPLINLGGTFVGMNFYDGRNVTPFLPRSKICEVLRHVNGVLPSERGISGKAIYFADFGSEIEEKMNKWPVPEAYWYHGGLDVDRHYVPMLRGRHLD